MSRHCCLFITGGQGLLAAVGSYVDVYAIVARRGTNVGCQGVEQPGSLCIHGLPFFYTVQSACNECSRWLFAQCMLLIGNMQGLSAYQACLPLQLH